jgi:uncharacterized protein (DUF2062 family)
MPRKFLKKYMPDPHEIKNHKYLSMFGTLLHSPDLWHMNRRSVAKAFMVGLFYAWWPVPFQMILAAGSAIFIRSNLPISVGLVWITNPVTMPVMFYFAYVVGTWIMGVPETDFEMELSIDWLMNGMLLIWKPFLTGCFVLAVISGIAGYFCINWAWHYSVVKRRSQSKDR